MNLLVVGVSYRTASVATLESLATAPADIPQMLTDLVSKPYVREALVLSTCNRVEVYAAVGAFHGGLSDIAEVLAARAGCSAAALAPHLYVHFDAEAARHAFRVASGLDSMVVGEAQILGQLRDAYAVASERDTAGRLIHDLMQHALRVGKRAHTETGIDRAGQNVVTAALAVASANLAGAESAPAVLALRSDALPALAGRNALVVGAGSMGSLALATLRRSGASQVTVANRDLGRATRLAELHDATAVPLAGLADAVAEADIVVCATAASSYVLAPEHVAPRAGGRPLIVLDLAVPRDVDPAVGGVGGVVLIDMEQLAAGLRGDTELGSDEALVDEIVAGEVDAFRAMLRGATVAPTVAALRARADEVVATELRRLRTRRPELSDDQRADVANAVHRVVQRLLHEPTVRVRALAAEPGGDRYAEVLRELFDLDIPPAPETAADVPGDVVDDTEGSQSA